jgi:hypothetical protein
MSDPFDIALWLDAVVENDDTEQWRDDPEVRRLTRERYLALEAEARALLDEREFIGEKLARLGAAQLLRQFVRDPLAPGTPSPTSTLPLWQAMGLRWREHVLASITRLEQEAARLVAYRGMDMDIGYLVNEAYTKILTAKSLRELGGFPPPPAVPSLRADG